jgi:hypothetical protein
MTPEEKEQAENLRLEYLRAILDGKYRNFVLSFVDENGDWKFLWEGGAIQAVGMCSLGLNRLTRHMLED